MTWRPTASSAGSSDSSARRRHLDLQIVSGVVGAEFLEGSVRPRISASRLPVGRATRTSSLTVCLCPDSGSPSQLPTSPLLPAGSPEIVWMELSEPEVLSI